MAVTGITLRNVKGSELTFTEMDNNFSNLKTAIEAIQTSTTIVTVDTAQTISGAKTFTNTMGIKGVNETVYNHGTTGGTITPDCSSGTVHKMVLNTATTINSLANAVTGSNITLIITQDGTGNRTLSSTMKFAQGLKTLSSAASSTDMISIFYDGTTYWASLAKGFA
jgi:hypothetical protein